MPEEGWAPLAEELAADVRRVADRLRTLSAARLAGQPAPPEDGMPPYRSRAQAARGAAQAMADAAAALESAGRRRGSSGGRCPSSPTSRSVTRWR